MTIALGMGSLLMEDPYVFYVVLAIMLGWIIYLCVTHRGERRYRLWLAIGATILFTFFGYRGWVRFQSKEVANNSSVVQMGSYHGVIETNQLLALVRRQSVVIYYQSNNSVSQKAAQQISETFIGCGHQSEMLPLPANAEGTLFFATNDPRRVRPVRGIMILVSDEPDPKLMVALNQIGASLGHSPSVQKILHGNNISMLVGELD